MTRTSIIPQESRRIVEWRDSRLCVRCGHKGGDWHHRRTRLVRDPHQHCACNGILLCRTCHAYVHRYPTIAKALGLIVSSHCEVPGMVPVKYDQGWFILNCSGEGQWVAESRIFLDEGVPMVEPTRLDL